MKDENKRDLCLKVRVSQAEIDAIKKKFENSGMSSLSGFVRFKRPNFNLQYNI